MKALARTRIIPTTWSMYVRHASKTTAVSKASLTNSEVAVHRVRLFEQEQKRQRQLVTEIEKIKVDYRDQPEHCTLYMNKKLSTPFDCTKHVSTAVGERAVIAEVDDQLWDLHRPLEDHCTLKFLHFNEADPYYANKAFWRSCSMMLGAVLESSFKSKHYVQLCSFPAPNVRTGSFVYDVDLGMEWQPTTTELKVLSQAMVKLSMKFLPFERLVVSVELAQDIFRHNQYKYQQIPLIAQDEERSDVTLYRVGNYIDISRGPMMSNTGHVGRVTIAAAHTVSCGVPGKTLTRIQGVALPQSILINHYNYGIIEKRAQLLNDGRLPNLSFMVV